MSDGTNENVTQTPAPSWFIDEGIPGVGERPQWLNEKFKTAADLAKSYAELEKRVGMVPEQYDLSKSKFIDPDYAPFQDFLQFAKEKRVPQEVMDKMVNSLDKYFDEFTIDKDAEFKKLGDNAQERVTTLDNWAKANLSKSAYEALSTSIKSAESIKALEEIRNKMMTNAPLIPNGNDSSSMNVQSLDEIRAELSQNIGKYKTDAAYRKDVQTRLERAAKDSGYIDKIGA